MGGPLHFLPELKKAFIRTLHLTPENVVDPENSHLFAAMGAALESGEAEPRSLDGLISQLEQGVQMAFELKRLPPLFQSQEEYRAFQARHSRARGTDRPSGRYRGNCYLGIDAGSTTTKLALVGQEGELLWSFLRGQSRLAHPDRHPGHGSAAAKLPPEAKILRTCSTGYGETLLKSAFCLDEGEVETIAHYQAAAFFDPEVDCILDIGGQDMKCIKIRNHSVDTIPPE